ncbi:MAG: aminodeoxychorismate lyase [Pseudomonadales bacterium]|nr:aminodeoxychorismate lyase [Pseudomonadales bacterium]
MLINGKRLDCISGADRGLAYGDGLFETLRLYQGRALLLEQHLERLLLGCRRLGIELEASLLESDIDQLRPEFSDYGILKLIVTRGQGGRGYRPEPTTRVTRLASLHPYPQYTIGTNNPEQGIAAFLCEQRLALQPALAGIKHLNRLEQVMASREWPGDEFMEGLMLDMNGKLIEGTRSNLFLVHKGRLLTPDLQQCGVNGVLRTELLKSFGTRANVVPCSLQVLLEAEEAFVCNSVFGVWPLLRLHISGRDQILPCGDYTRQAQHLFEEILADRHGN